LNLKVILSIKNGYKATAYLVCGHDITSY